MPSASCVLTVCPLPVLCCQYALCQLCAGSMPSVSCVLAVCPLSVVCWQYALWQSCAGSMPSGSCVLAVCPLLVVCWQYALWQLFADSMPSASCVLTIYPLAGSSPNTGVLPCQLSFYPCSHPISSRQVLSQRLPFISDNADKRM